MNTYNNNQCGMHIQRSKGFTLLEALIGFLVLAIGMLGIASLQAVSLKSGKTSVYNSIVTMKVDELFESMRANATTTALATYSAAGTTAGAGQDNSCTGAKDCTGPQLAQEDIFWWKKNLKAGLPGSATGSVVVTPPVGASKMAIATITVSWKERNKDSEVASTKTYASTVNICTENPC